MSEPFDSIPFDDIKGDWKKLGSGSFGNVYKGSYLGIDVAIKEVLPSKDYDVAKYFEREWRLMKECRHPNICLFIGLSRAPPPDNRIFIISEYIENGNVRLYIHDKSKPFPWRLRLSFAIDVARALAYLHARKCIHRDLKGENLLVTSNGRIKVTDFGFARIAARNEEESKRLTFCGTDAYMSPEIQLGDEFDLPTDIFSLGVIFCEISSRKLADDTHFKRHPPDFGIDVAEVRTFANPGCPLAFVDLAIDCLNLDPGKRPTTRVILERLQSIEAELLLRPDEGEDVHVGSIKFLTGGKRPAGAPRIPSFGLGIGKDIRNHGNSSTVSSAPGSDDSDDEELIEALSKLGFQPDSASTTGSSIPLLDTTNTSTPSSAGSGSSRYSTNVVRSHMSQKDNTPSGLSSILTIKAHPDPNAVPPPVRSSTDTPLSSPGGSGPPVMGDGSTFSIATLDSYRTAHGSAISSALATQGGSSIGSVVGGVHRFTLIKPGMKPRKIIGNGITATQSGQHHHGGGGAEGYGPTPVAGGSAIGFAWNPLDLFFSSGLLTAKCDVCFKRLGWRPVMECDDCGMRAHEKCGEVAPKDCGLRPYRPGVHHRQSLLSPLQAMSPLSKAAKRDTVGEGMFKTKSQGVGLGTNIKR